MFMMLLAKIGAFIIIPFLAFSAWFGGAAQTSPATVPPPTATSTPPPTTSPAHPAAPINGPVTVSSVSQTSGIAVGATVILAGSGFTADNTILLDGMAAVKDAQVASSANGHQTLAFTMPSSVGPDCKPDEACAMYLRLLTSGTYNLAVENEKGISNTIAVTIIGAASL